MDETFAQRVDRDELLADVRRVLGEDGLLEQTGQFHFRSSQLDMALDVAESIADGLPAIVEGGTGIGKTLAYLVPALLSGAKVVVATGTKTLQEQIFFKDLPQLLDALNLDVSAAYMKGRSNYLCLHRFERFNIQATFKFKHEGTLYQQILDWAPTTPTGDRAELTELPEDFSAWPQISSTHENCLGSKCGFYDKCHVMQMRKRAQDADIVIVNHHLLFADLAVRQGDFGQVIPDHDVLILDEAHNLEDVASQYFGLELSSYRILQLLDDVRREVDNSLLLRSGLQKTLESVKAEAGTFFDLFRSTGETRFRLLADFYGPSEQEVFLEFHDSLETLQREIADLADDRPDLKSLKERCTQVMRDLTALVTMSDEGQVYWAEVRPRSVSLRATPLDIGPLLGQTLFATDKCLIFTSATLSTGGDFRFFKTRLGFPEDAREGLYPSPFDYQRRALTYVPSAMPEPWQQEYGEACVTIGESLIKLCGGGALFLFTSYANMDLVYEGLKDKLDFPLFKQGDAPRGQLLERFRDHPDSVLFATGTFWEGVDIVGESLRLVIIDKLPFASPGEPIIEARVDYLKTQGKNPFRDYQLPEAVISLKQGYGRLIRSRDDYGIVAILDNRLYKKSYGKVFFRSLPKAPVVERYAKARDWWRFHHQAAKLPEGNA